MQKPQTFSVIGGDRRMDHLSKYLSREYPVIRWISCQPFASLEETVALGKHLVFPMPFSRDGIHIAGTEETECTVERILPMLKKGHLSLLGGSLPEDVLKRCDALGIHTFDWMEMEDVALPNAVLTAEAAIAEAVLHGGRSLGGRHCLILGYGRCAQTLARRLRYLVKDVAVAARNPFQRLSAQSDGFTTFSLTEMYDALPGFDLLFNTVPAMILPGKYASALSRDTVLLDLASGPLQTHIETERFFGNAFSCPGLPGKYFPKDAGEILARAALSRLIAPV